jgi:hypothetical protein
LKITLLPTLAFPASAKVRHLLVLPLEALICEFELE